MLGLMLFCAAGIVSAQNSTMRFAVESWDFGTVEEEDGAISHTFQFTNTGDKPFVIENVATTCGCTTPRYNREPIMPGKSGSIDITYDPAGRPGPFNREVVIVSNGRTNRNVLKIMGEVTPRPMTIQDEFPSAVGQNLLASRTSPALGYVGRGTSKTATLEVYNNSAGDMKLAVVYDKPASYFKAELDKQTLKPKERGRVTVKYDLASADSWGMLSNTFYVTVNGVKCNMPFIVTGIATDDFSAMTREQQQKAPKGSLQTQYYHFGDVKKGSERSREFTLTNQGSEPLIIRHVGNNGRISSNLEAGTVVQPGADKKFTVTVKTNDEPAGRYMQSLIIIINDPLRPMREIRLAATLL